MIHAPDFILASRQGPHANWALSSMNLSSSGRLPDSYSCVVQINFYHFPGFIYRQTGLNFQSMGMYLVPSHASHHIVISICSVGLHLSLSSLYSLCCCFTPFTSFIFLLHCLCTPFCCFANALSFLLC